MYQDLSYGVLVKSCGKIGCMDFPITDLMDRDACVAWIGEYFHPEGLRCAHCGADLEQAWWFRRTKRSQLDVYHCQERKGIYNV